MPKRNSINRSIEETPPKDDYSPIKQSTFYGISKSKPKAAAIRSPTTNLSSSLSEKLKLSGSGSKKGSTGGKKSTPPVTRRTSSSSRKTGINKGVQHAIKKPKPQKKPVAKKETKETEEEKKWPKIVQPVLKPTPTPTRTGKLAMTKHTNVTYELKHGQFEYRLKRSPRKSSPYYKQTPVTPKTPKHLFTPSSRNDFLLNQSPSPTRSGRKRMLPSPVKFHGEVDDDEDEEEDGNLDTSGVANIIDNLEQEEEEQQEEQTGKDKSQDQYTMFVTDDEVAQVAQEAVQQLEEIEMEDQRKQSMPTDVHIETSDEIREILASMAPPTADEVKANRGFTTMDLDLELHDDSSNEAILESAKDKTDTPVKAKLFPIFDKTNQLQNSTNRRKNNNSNSNTPNKKQIVGSSGKENSSSNIDDSQMIIDAGQKNVGLESCLQCNIVYNPKNAEDERAHRVQHSHFMGVIKFKGWKNENVVGGESFHDGRIIKVGPSDPKSHWEKVMSVLEVVDKQLGIDNAGRPSIRNMDNSQVYLFIDPVEGRIAGFLLAELLKDDDRLSRAEPNPKNREDWVLHDIMSKSKVLVGISRIWVSQDYQRRQIATRLVLAMERTFLGGKKFLKRGEEYAFSHTTPIGSKFASSITGHKNSSFLTYAPSLAGLSN